MKLHPRHEQMTKAGLEIQEAITAASVKHDLTDAEVISILSVYISSIARFQIRGERES